MPAEYRQPLFELYDRVIVPSEFCANVIGVGYHPRFDEDGSLEGLAKAGLHVVPHCFDPDFWKPPLVGAVEPARTAFYAIGAWGDRKNQLGVLKAYLGEFDVRDPVSLTMWIPNADFAELSQVIASSGIPQDRLPALAIPDGPELSEEQLLAMHASHDCFVSATRGEGWGLGMFEAAIMGKAVIAPLWGGQSDFLSEYSAHEFVPHQLTPCFGSLHMRLKNGQPAIVIDKPPGVMCKQKWADPSLEHVASLMRDVHNDRMAHELNRGSADDRADLEAKFSYETIGPLLLNALQGATR